jgi:hypothetical protein
MDHIPDEDMPAVAKASHAVVQEAVNAGVWVLGGGLEDQKASIVAWLANSRRLWGQTIDSGHSFRAGRCGA